MEDVDLQQAEGWRPEPGDVLIGCVVALDKGWSNYGGGSYYPIITILPDSGGAPVALHCFHSGLLSRVRDLRPKQGERIGVRYKGTVPVKSDPSRTVAVYVVKIDGRDADIWDDVGPATPAATPQRWQQPPEPDATPQQPPAQQPLQDDDIPF